MFPPILFFFPFLVDDDEIEDQGPKCHYLDLIYCLCVLYCIRLTFSIVVCV